MRWLSRHPKLTLTLFLLIALSGFFYYFLFQPALTLYRESKILPRLLRPARNAVLRQDLASLAFEMKYLSPHPDSINNSAKRLSIFSPLPGIGIYFRDFKNLTAAFLPVYDGLIDFAGTYKEVFNTVKFEGWGKLGPAGGGGSGEIAEVLPGLREQLLKFKDKVLPLSRAILAIDEKEYPAEFRGRKIRDNLKKIKELAQISTHSFDDFLELFGLVPEILGTQGGQNYLILIQNEKEPRPGGGFLSGYAFISLENGQMRLLKSGDASFLDENPSLARPPVPPSLRPLIKTVGLRLKDANDSPDFKVSAQQVISLWQKTKDYFPLQGIVALDGQFLSTLTRIEDEIRLDDGTTVNGENVDEFLNKFFSSAGSRNLERQRQKGLTSFFLAELIKKTLSTIPQNYSRLLPQVWQMGQEKHFTVFFTNEKLEKLAEKYNLAGRIKDYGGDYLHVNHALFAPSRQSWNLKEKVIEDVKIEVDKIISNLTIELEAKPDSTQNPQNTFSDYLRLYVPKGSRILETNGFPQKVKAEEDLGKTVFSSLVKVTVGEKTTLNLQYEIPRIGTSPKEYRLLIQKQPGTPNFDYVINVNDKSQEFKLSEDKEIQVKL